MMPRAVIFDVYGTLLSMGPAPADAASRWQSLCRAALPSSAEPPLELAEFNRRTEQRIAMVHREAKAAGVAYPEIDWPIVAGQAWPSLRDLSRVVLEDFLFEHAQLQHTVKLAEGAAEVLRHLAGRDILLGLASNGQFYTVRELKTALGKSGLSESLFVPDLCFYSFLHGFSKPDPQVFLFLAEGLARRELRPAQALCVGDRMDNDIVPARQAGFGTWHLSNQSTPGTGSWRDLRAMLSRC
jgi:FMN phosphatase YigB (HAD superfamily)